MRVVLSAIILIAMFIAAYVYWWNQVSGQLLAEATQWEEARLKEGYEISHTAFEISGFPYRVKLSTQDINIRNPLHERKPKLEMEELWLIAQPWNITQFVFGTAGPLTTNWSHKNSLRKMTITPEEFIGSGDFTLDGKIENLALDIRRADYQFSWQSSFFVERSQIHTRPAPDATDIEIDIAVQIDNVDIAEGGNPYLGDNIKTIDITGTLKGKIDRGNLKGSLQSWRDDGGILDLTKIDIKWGPADVVADGTLTLDGKMRPLGAFSTKIAGYRQILQALAKNGRIQVELAATAAFGLDLLAKTNEQGIKTLTMPVTAQDGGLYLGPVKLMDLTPVFIR